MAYPPTYAVDAPERAEIDALPGRIVLEFGAGWCGYCQGAQAAISTVLGGEAGLSCLKIEDGPGRRLGRSFRIKLWPTLVFIRNGREIARVVRPTGEAELRDALARLRAA